MIYDLLVDLYEFHPFDHYLHHDHSVELLNEEYVETIGKFLNEYILAK